MRLRSAFLLYLLFIAAHSALWWYMYRTIPAARHSWIREGRLMENLTAVSFLIAALLATYKLTKVGKGAWLSTLALIPLISFAGVLDELSFGMIYTSVQPPKLHGENIDGVHDILHLVHHYIDPYSPFPKYDALILMAFVGLAGSGFFLFLSRKHDAFRFVAIAAPLVAAALYIDMGMTTVRRWGLSLNRGIWLEELLELSAALTMVAAALRLRAYHPAPSLESSDSQSPAQQSECSRPAATLAVGE